MRRSLPLDARLMLSHLILQGIGCLLGRDVVFAEILLCVGPIIGDKNLFL